MGRNNIFITIHEVAKLDLENYNQKISINKNESYKMIQNKVNFFKKYCKIIKNYLEMNIN